MIFLNKVQIQHMNNQITDGAALINANSLGAAKKIDGYICNEVIMSHYEFYARKYPIVDVVFDIYCRGSLTREVGQK